MADFREIITDLESWHFYDVFLPFILVYVVIFAILEKSKMFKVSGDGDNGHVKNVHAIISLVFALFVVASIQTVQYIQSIITNIVLIVIFILVILVLLAFVFGDDYFQLFMDKKGDGWELQKPIALVIAGLIVVVVLIILFGSLGWWKEIEDFFGRGSFDSDSIGSFVLIVLVIIVLVWITRGNSGKK